MARFQEHLDAKAAERQTVSNYRNTSELHLRICYDDSQITILMIIKLRHSLQSDVPEVTWMIPSQGEPVTPDSSTYTINTRAVSLLKYNCYHMEAKPRGLGDPQPEPLSGKTFYSSAPCKRQNSFCFAIDLPW